MRHPTPEIVQVYQQRKKEGPPRCCHTCDFYTQDGRCMRYDMEPPQDFAATVDACDEYQEEIPF